MRGHESSTLCRIALAVWATLFPTFFFAFMIELPALAPTRPSRPPLFFGVVSPSAMVDGCARLVAQCVCVVGVSGLVAGSECDSRVL